MSVAVLPTIPTKSLIDLHFVDFFRGTHWCRDCSVVRLWRIDPMVSGSNPPSAEISLGVMRFASSL